MWDFIVGTFILFIVPMLPLLYLGLALFLSWLVMRWIKRRIGPERLMKRWGAGLATFAILLLLPTWNIIGARFYMKYLCEKEGGVTVYRTVALPDDYFNEYGVPLPEKKFIHTQTKQVEYSCFGDDCYEVSYKRTTVLSLPPGSKVSRLEISYLDPVSGNELGNEISFAHSTWYSWERSAAICPNHLHVTSVGRQVFVPSTKN